MFFFTNFTNYMFTCKADTLDQKAAPLCCGFHTALLTIVNKTKFICLFMMVNMKKPSFTIMWLNEVNADISCDRHTQPAALY